MIRRLACLLCAVCALVLVTACGVYVPEGATVVVVKNTNQTFDRGEMRPLNGLRAGELIRMKWYDDNTYMTPATLEPGTYSFRARNYQGGGLERQIQVTADKHLYEVDGGSKGDAAADDAAEALKLTGKIAFPPGQRRFSTVAILFIGSTIEMRTVSVDGEGNFSSSFPHTGNWRVELHATGNPPLSFVHDTIDAQAPVNLGTITLK